MRITIDLDPDELAGAQIAHDIATDLWDVPIIASVIAKIVTAAADQLADDQDDDCENPF